MNDHGLGAVIGFVIRLWRLRNCNEGVRQWGCFLNTASIFTVIVLEKDFINIIEHAIISIARLKKKQW